jgi:hypothetical protein|tara:strand:+ start:594 stop:950 length:357 start_codon:yes stop_codon:yes gene_type:complete
MKAEESMDKDIKGTDLFEAVRDYLAEANPEALLADGLENALVGACDRFGQQTLAAYDYDKCIEILAKEIAKDMKTSDIYDLEDDPYTLAIETFDYNTIGAWMGDNTPVFIKLKFEEYM